MDLPDRLLRHPTAAAIDSLARRFKLPSTPTMQDWEYQVADSERIDEFWAAYTSGELSDDELFVLMETLIESFNLLPDDPERDARWPNVLAALDRGIHRHFCTVWYWSCVGEDDSGNWFRTTRSIREVLARHRDGFVDA